MSFDFSTLITDRTASDVDAGNAKGTYNSTDMNRVEAAVDYVAGRLRSFGNFAETSPKNDWATEDVPTISQMKQYLDDVAALRAVLAVLPTTPEAPEDIDGMTYTEANDIEQILKDIGLLTTNMAAEWFYSGDLYAGEV